MSEVVLSLDQISFTYPGASQSTLQIESMQIKKGERVFIFGPSGSGKTTFLEMLAGVLVPQKGEVQILGQKMQGLSNSARDQLRADHLGYIFQSFNLLPYLSVVENVLLPLNFSQKRQSRLASSNAREVAQSLLAELGMQNFLESPVSRLSVGQQQRVAVARALLGNPEIILADEPTSALDQDHRTKFIELLFGLAKKNGTTVLFVSHDRALQSLFDRSLDISVMKSGSGL